MNATTWIKVKLLRIRGHRGRRWVARWRVGGRWGQKNVPARFARSSASREAFRAGVENRLNGLGGMSAAEARISLEEAAKAFQAAKVAKGLKASALATYGYVLGKFCTGPRPRLLGDLLPAHVAAFVSQAAHSAATRRKHWAHLRAFLRWCVRQGYLASNPLDALEQPIARGPTPFAYEERDVLAILKALRSRPTWSQASLRLAILAGLRFGELADLAAADIDFAARLVRVPAQKSAEDRWVVVDESTAGLLHELRYRGPRMLWGPPEAPVVTRSTLAAQLRQEVRTTCAAAGIEAPPKPLQHLRSTFATMAASAGVSELALAATMGHQSIATTRKFYIAARKARQAAEAQDRVQRALDAVRAELGDPAGDTPAAGEPSGKARGDGA